MLFTSGDARGGDYFFTKAIKLQGRCARWTGNKAGDCNSARNLYLVPLTAGDTQLDVCFNATKRKYFVCLFDKWSWTVEQPSVHMS